MCGRLMDGSLHIMDQINCEHDEESASIIYFIRNSGTSLIIDRGCFMMNWGFHGGSNMRVCDLSDGDDVMRMQKKMSINEWFANTMDRIIRETWWGKCQYYLFL